MEVRVTTGITFKLPDEKEEASKFYSDTNKSSDWHIRVDDLSSEVTYWKTDVEEIDLNAVKKPEQYATCFTCRYYTNGSLSYQCHSCGNYNHWRRKE